MANEFITSELISKDAAVEFKNNLTFIATANRQYEGMWSNGTYDAGRSVDIRMDNVIKIQRGDTVTKTAIKESFKPLELKPLYTAAVGYKSTDLTTEMYQGWSERVLKPAIAGLASRLNFDVAKAAKTETWYKTGAVNALINSFSSFEEPAVMMQNLAVPFDTHWYYAMTPRNQWALKSQANFQNSFNTRLNTEINERSALGHLGSFDIFVDQGINNQSISGNKGAGPIEVDANAATGSNEIALKGLSANANINAGETFTITGIQTVNRITKEPTGDTMSFVVTEDVQADGSGDVVVNVQPALFGPENFERQMMSRLPVEDDVVVFDAGVSDYKVNLAYSRNALHLVLPPLAKLDAPESYVFNSPEEGLSLRVSKTAEVLDNENILRIDILAGYMWIGDQTIRVHSAITGSA